MKLPVSPNEKYSLIALNASADIKGVLDLGHGLFALQGGVLQLPKYWKETLGSVQSSEIEEAAFVLLAKGPSERPSVLDDEGIKLRERAKSLYVGLLATGRFGINGEAIWLTGAHVDGAIEIRARGRLPPVLLLPGLPWKVIDEVDLRRAAALAPNILGLVAARGMLRMKLALQTFGAGFAERDLGQRIHQFVRVVSDGFCKAKGRHEFVDRCIVFAGKTSKADCRQLYLMRNNAEHFNRHDQRLGRLSVRGSLERGHQRAHQAEALARHCFAHFLKTRHLWRHFRYEAQIDGFWKRSPEECAALWGTEPLDLKATVAEFEPRELM